MIKDYEQISRFVWYLEVLDVVRVVVVGVETLDEVEYDDVDTELDVEYDE